MALENKRRMRVDPLKIEMIEFNLWGHTDKEEGSHQGDCIPSRVAQTKADTISSDALQWVNVRTFNDRYYGLRAPVPIAKNYQRKEGNPHRRRQRNQ